MSLRTYSLITHPAYLRFIETGSQLRDLPDAPSAASVPAHRPRLESILQISEYMGVSSDIVRSVILYKSRHYRKFSIPKRGGGNREISAPRTFLKTIQFWILDTILNNSYFPEFVYGFVRGRSYIDNARSHVGSSYILNMDVQDFFPSISAFRVQGIFEKLDYEPEVARLLTEIVTLNGGLPQGAPSSPMLANHAFLECDFEIKQFAEGNGLKYTRYADDLTFSSSIRIPASVVDEIAILMKRGGFRPNPKKTRFMGKNQVKEVTGLVLSGNGVALRRDYLNSARGFFHRVASDPVCWRSKERHIKGCIEHIRHVGGRGSEAVLKLGAAAIDALERQAENDRRSLDGSPPSGDNYPPVLPPA